MFNLNYDILFRGAMALLMLALYLAILGLFLLVLKNMVYSMLKSMFGKKQAASESEPGQALKKAKKAAPVPAAAALADEPDAVDMGDVPQEPSGPAVAAATQQPAPSRESAAFADRLADEFEAHQVTA